MPQDLSRDVRWLKCYAVLSTLGFAVVALAAFRGQARSARFDVLDVERLNVLTRDGKYAVVISNADRMPGNVLAGKEHPYPGSRGGGLLFFNRDGDEAGGLIFDNEHRDTSILAFGQLSLDRFGSDQVAALRYYEDPGGWWDAGLQVSHFTRGSLYEWHSSRDSLLQLPPARRDSATRALRTRFIREGKFEIKRVFVGEEGRNAILRMNDTRGRTRIRMMVDSLNVARIEFLDEKGAVVQRIPQ